MSFSMTTNSTFLYNFYLSENIDEFCRANPSVIQEYADNCAMYINCSRPGHYITECQYPDLYSPLTKSCQPFKSVKCGTRPEPQKPCKSAICATF
jgi:hypothetical protein